MDHLGVQQIHLGWIEFTKANPGLKDCELKSTQLPDGTINFEVKLGGMTHVHVFNPFDMGRHAMLRDFLVGLTDVSRQRGAPGPEPHPQEPTVLLSVLGRRKMILEAPR